MPPAPEPPRPIPATTVPGNHGPLHSHCENCGTALQGAFCHRCGQHDFEFHRSFRHVIIEALDNFLDFDAKFFRNIITLLFSPGKLTAEFNAGQRVSQMPPFRLYLFVAFLFFLFSATGSHLGSPIDTGNSSSPAERTAVNSALDQALHDVEQHTGDPAARVRATRAIRRLQAHVYDPTAEPMHLATLGPAIAAEIKREEAAEKSGKPPAQILHATNPNGVRFSVEDRSGGTPFERFMTERGRNALEHQAELMDSFFHALPKMLLVCVPLFALYTRVLFRKSGQVYLQHLVAAIHFHTFIFLWVLVRDGWGDIVHFGSHRLETLLVLGFNLWMFVYPLLMFRRLFSDSWFWTILKAGVIGFAYLLTLGIGFVVTALILLLLL